MAPISRFPIDFLIDLAQFVDRAQRVDVFAQTSVMDRPA
jgi:hypothetical protein